MIIRTGQAIDGTPEITGLSKTSDLSVGMYIYNSKFPIGTRIFSVDSGTEITATRNSSYTGSVSIEFSPDSPDMKLQRCTALRDVKSVVDERGDIVKIILRYEDNVSRDSYKSVKKRDQETVVFMKAYPIEVRPSEKQLEKAGIREKVDIIVWTAMLDWITQDVSFNEIEFATRTTVVWQDDIYEIRDKSMSGQVGSTFLYLNLGLTKR